MKLSPVLLVDAIEPSLDFWVRRLGFKKVVQVPDGERLGFAILEHGGAEIMLQTRASLAKDVPALAQGSLEKSGVTLFVEVDDLGPFQTAVKDCPVVFPERTTFYGMREIGVRSPEGCVVVLAARITK